MLMIAWRWPCVLKGYTSKILTPTDATKLERLQTWIWWPHMSQNQPSSGQPCHQRAECKVLQNLAMYIGHTMMNVFGRSNLRNYFLRLGETVISYSRRSHHMWWFLELCMSETSLPLVSLLLCTFLCNVYHLYLILNISLVLLERDMAPSPFWFTDDPFQLVFPASWTIRLEITRQQKKWKHYEKVSTSQVHGIAIMIQCRCVDV